MPPLVHVLAPLLGLGIIWRSLALKGDEFETGSWSGDLPWSRGDLRALVGDCKLVAIWLLATRKWAMSKLQGAIWEAVISPVLSEWWAGPHPNRRRKCNDLTVSFFSFQSICLKTSYPFRAVACWHGLWIFFAWWAAALCEGHRSQLVRH